MSKGFKVFNGLKYYNINNVYQVLMIQEDVNNFEKLQLFQKNRMIRKDLNYFKSIQLF